MKLPIALATLVVTLPSCSKVESLVGGGSAGAAPATSAAASAAAPMERVAAADAVCTSAERKVWGKWANRRTGITAARIGGQLAVGVALGNDPHLLVFDDAGSGRLVKVKAPDGSPLAKDLKAPDRRDLHRVTPAKSGAGITAYADYRDKYKDGRRRIACGPVQTEGSVLVFDGKPLLDRDDEKKEEPKAEEKPTVAAKPRLRVPAMRALRGLVKPGEAADAAPPAADPAARKLEEKKKKTERELRDCRTFVDADGSVWGVGSQLHGEEQDDGSTKWTMRLFAAPDGGRGYVLLHSVALPKEPKTLHTFESPVATQVGDGHVVFARYQNHLMGWGMKDGFRPTGGVRVYKNGYPTLPHFMDDVLVASHKVDGDRYELSWAPLGSAAPKSLTKLALDVGASSFAEPTLAKAGAQRWLSYQTGARREGALSVVPVDAELKRAGRPHEVTPSGVTVYESHLFGIAGDKLLAVYIQNGEPGAELVSEVLSCSVKT